jgi:hypothetical protein
VTYPCLIISLSNKCNAFNARKRGGWCLSKRVKPLCHLFKCKSENQERSMSAKETSVFKDPDITENLSTNSRQICFVLPFRHNIALTSIAILTFHG